MKLRDLTDDQLRTLRREWDDKIDDAKRGLDKMPPPFHRYVEQIVKDHDPVNKLLSNEREYWTVGEQKI